MELHINAPINREEIKNLKAGDYIYVTGTIYTARDAAHKRMQEALDRGRTTTFFSERECSILYGAISRKRGASHWLSRAYYSKPDGQIYSCSFGFGGLEL